MGRKWGQHFLRSRSTVERIIQAAELGPDDIVVEIGPGEGVLTFELCRRAGHVHAFEVDPDLAQALKVKGEPKLSVHLGDVLKQDVLESLGEHGQRPVTVVANLPYYITAPILELLFWERPFSISKAVLMMQHEVALRVTEPASREAGALTYIVGAFFEADYLFKVPPGCFSPPPKVDSAVIKVTPSENSSATSSRVSIYEKIVATAFQARRKQLGRSLRALHPEASEILQETGLDSRRRPETLTVQEFWELARNWRHCE